MESFGQIKGEPQQTKGHNFTERPKLSVMEIKERFKNHCVINTYTTFKDFLNISVSIQSGFSGNKKK